jgi:hypothetical protein
LIEDKIQQGKLLKQGEKIITHCNELSLIRLYVL